MGVTLRLPGQNPLEDRLIELFEEAGIRGGSTAVLADLIVAATAEAVPEGDPGKQLTLWFNAIERDIPEARKKFASR